MILYQLPNNKGQIRQSNRGDVFGEIVSSFNLDYTSSPGKLKVSKKLEKVLSYSDLGNKYIQDIISNNDTRYAATNGAVYKCLLDDDPTDSGNWSQETLVTDTLDQYTTTLEIFDGDLLISDQGDIHKLSSTYDNNWWTGTVSGTALDTNEMHYMHVHRGGQETLFVTDAENIRYYNATAGHSAISIDSSLTSYCIGSGVNSVWVGTLSMGGESAYVYECYVGEQIGGVPVARNAYKIDARGVFAIAVYQNIPYIVTETGVIQAFDGYGFRTVAEFPFAAKYKKLFGVKPSTIYPTNARPVSPKGMKVIGDSIFIYIKMATDTTYINIDEKSPSGIWEYNLKTGNLTHRFAPADSTDQIGQTKLPACGPIYSDPGQEAFLLAGGGSVAHTDSGLFAVAETDSNGYFVTPEISSGGVKDYFNKLTIKAKTPASGEKIVFKYRTSTNTNYPQYNGITWTGATTFTTTDTSFTNVSVGDEIEVVDGYGAGKLAHVTNISYSNPTYTVTIDESIGSNTETSDVRVDNWTKLTTEYDDTSGEYKEIAVGVSAPWIQFKVSLIGSIELRSVVLSSNVKNHV